MNNEIIEDSCKGCDISMQAEAVCEICTKNKQLQTELNLASETIHLRHQTEISLIQDVDWWKEKVKQLQAKVKALEDENKDLKERYIKTSEISIQLQSRLRDMIKKAFTKSIDCKQLQAELKQIRTLIKLAKEKPDIFSARKLIEQALKGGAAK